MKKLYSHPSLLLSLTLLWFGLLSSFSASAQLQYLTTVPPLAGGNGSSIAAFNVKALKTIRIREVYCTFSSTSSQTTLVWYKTDSLNASPSISAANGWVQASSYTHSPATTGIGTMVICSDTSLNILIPQGAVYAIAVTGASITYSGSSSTAPTTPYIFSDTNLYMNMNSFCGWGGTISSPINYRSFNGKLGYQIVNLATDAGLQSFQEPSDTVCSGIQPVIVGLKNHGPNTLQNVAINWSVNNIPQTPYLWSGNLPVGNTLPVQIGTFQFNTGTSYSVQAYTSLPNNVADTVHSNDTILKTGIIVKPSPTLTLSANTFNICSGDTAHITMTLTGTSPWSLIISDGTNNIPYNNITTPSYSANVVPLATATYTLVSLTDATGCQFTEPQTIQVLVNPAPPAVITPQGSPAACLGDSVTMMASVGLNFTYVWFKDGVQIPGAQLYVLHAKEGGNYTVQVTSPIGCKKLSAPQLVTIHPLPVVNLGNDTVLLLNKNLQLNAGAGFTGYFWSTGATGQFVTIDTANTGTGVQTVWVIVTDNNGCVGSDTLKINFTNNPGMEEAPSDLAVRVSPNPTTGITEIGFSDALSGQVLCEIYSQDGRKVHEAKGEPGNRQLRLDLSHLAAGQYLLKLTSGTWSSTEKLLIIKE